MTDDSKGKTVSDLIYLLFFKSRAHRVTLITLVLLTLGALLFLRFKNIPDTPTSTNGTVQSPTPGSVSPSNPSTPKPPSSITLSGLVKDDVTNTPIPNLAVYIKGNTCFTDSLGRYTLPLDPACKPGDALTLYTNNTEYGAHESPCILPADYHLDIAIPKDASSRFVIGIIKDARTNEPIPDIEVLAEVEDVNIHVDPVTTDSFGKFKIPISKLQLRNEHDVRLLLKDHNHRYKTPAEPALQNINSFLILALEKQSHPPITLQVNSFTPTKIFIKAGSVTEIEAQGNINLGPFVGTTDPDGKGSGVFNLSLRKYCIASHINHGALMYRLTGDADWQVAGRKAHFISSRDGFLEFQINDNKQADNEGAFDVTVSTAD